MNWMKRDGESCTIYKIYKSVRTVISDMLVYLNNPVNIVECVKLSGQVFDFN